MQYMFDCYLRSTCAMSPSCALDMKIFFVVISCCVISYFHVSTSHCSVCLSYRLQEGMEFIIGELNMSRAAGGSGERR